MGNICNSEGSCCGNPEIEQRSRQKKRRIDKKLKGEGIFENIDAQTAAESEFEQNRQTETTGDENPFEISSKRKNQKSFESTP